MRLMVATYERRKPTEKNSGPLSQHLAQLHPGGCRHSTDVFAVEIWDRHRSQSASCGPFELHNDEDNDDEDNVLYYATNM